MDLLIQHGANVNAQVTGTKTYSLRIARAPSANEGVSALHTAVQARRADVVRYLIEKGINTELVDSNRRKAVDLLDIPAPPANRGGPAVGSTASVVEIRTLLQNASAENR
jgi:ankyrin repeat protein